jgi:hypothetical protein
VNGVVSGETNLSRLRADGSLHPLTITYDLSTNSLEVTLLRYSIQAPVYIGPKQVVTTPTATPTFHTDSNGDGNAHARRGPARDGWSIDGIHACRLGAAARSGPFARGRCVAAPA